MIRFRSPLQVPLVVVRSWHPTHGCYGYFRHIDRNLVLHIYIYYIGSTTCAKIAPQKLIHRFPMHVPVDSPWFEVLGAEIEHRLPLDWPNQHGTVAALAQQLGSHVMEVKKAGPRGWMVVGYGWIWLDTALGSSNCSVDSCFLMMDDVLVFYFGVRKSVSQKNAPGIDWLKWAEVS